MLQSINELLLLVFLFWEYHGLDYKNQSFSLAYTFQEQQIIFFLIFLVQKPKKFWKYGVSAVCAEMKTHRADATKDTAGLQQRSASSSQL